MLIAVTLLLVSLLAPTPGAAPVRSSSHDHSSDDGPLVLHFPDGVARIPFDLRGNHIYMRGRINDSDSLWIVLDTGASGNVIEADLAKRLGMEVTATGQGQGAGGVVEIGRIPAATIRLPGLTLEASIVAMSLSAFERQTGRPMNAIIGFPLLDRCVVSVDYAGRMLEIRPADGFEYRGKGAELPITFDRNLPYAKAKVTLPGRKPLAGRFVIDSGSSQALILSPQLIHDQHVDEVIGKTVEARGRGVGGQLASRVGRVERLEFAGVSFERPVTVLPADDAHIGAPKREMLGNIGGEILRRFTVIYDYRRRRMILEPNAQVGEPFEHDMSGIAPRMGPAGSNALEVEWIQAESPAAEAGVKAGDLIEQVDGLPAIEVGVPGLRQMLRRVGETHRFTIRRGDQRLEVALTMRRLI